MSGTRLYHLLRLRSRSRHFHLREGHGTLIIRQEGSLSILGKEAP